MKHFLILLIISFLVGCVATTNVPPVIAATVPHPVVTPVATHSLYHFGFWLDTNKETKEFTTFITIQIGCDDPQTADKAISTLQNDDRKIVWWSNMFGFSNGYYLRNDYLRCWTQLKEIMRPYQVRTVAIWLLDEPPDVAYGNKVGEYNPNLYNPIIETALSVIHNDYPLLKVGLNYGHIPTGLVVPSTLDIVGLEVYDGDWKDKLTTLEGLTSGEIWLLPRAFINNNDTTDKLAVEQLQLQYALAQIDFRIKGFYPFLWCCDDTVTGDKMFYSLNSDLLPLTKQQMIGIGTLTKKGT